MRLFDSHLHLDVAAFEPDWQTCLTKAASGCVAYRALVPGIEAGAFAHQRARAAAFPDQLRCAFGIHPLHAATASEADLNTLSRYLDDPLAVAVGEIGLDALLPAPSMALQEALFIAQLEKAYAAGLPVILHLRKTHDRALALLRRFPPCGGIVHAFNGALAHAQAFIDRGFRLGFGGAATGPNATRLQGLFKTLPLAALVLETDAPWMNPPWRPKGVRNTPETLHEILTTLAALRELPAATLAEHTFHNACDALRWPACDPPFAP